MVDAAAVPLSPAAREMIAGSGDRLISALTGGDDYEILFTASDATGIQIASLSRELGVPITRIGRLISPPHTAGGPVTLLDENSQPMRLGAEGWTHF